MMIALLCAVASATAFFLAHGTANLWLLAWIAPVPLLWLAFGNARVGHVALSAFAGYFFGQLGMLAPYLRDMGPMVFLAAAGPALAFVLLLLAARFSHGRLSPFAAVFVFPALWIGWEAGVSRLSPHGSFGAWGYSQASAPLVIEIASLFGVWSVSFLLALFATGVAMSLRRRTPLPLAVALALTSTSLGFGARRSRTHNEPTIRVAAAARNHDDHASPLAVSNEQAAEVRRLARQGATIVVFTEKTALMPAAGRESVLAPLVAAARETGTLVVTGFDVAGVERRNVAFAIAADGTMERYTKRHHIPGLEGGYSPGDQPGLLGDGLAMVICKDMDFQETLRADAAAAVARGGLAVMLVPAWDFGADGWLHARMSIMRGVEGGYAIARAASNGLVTISDARGRVLASDTSGSSRYVSVIAKVPARGERTIYLRMGDWAAWAAGIAGVVLVLWSATRPVSPVA